MRKQPSSSAGTKWILELGFLGWLMFLMTGCEAVQEYSLTYRLWDNDDLRKWSEPAANPNLALFSAPEGSDAVVEYDQVSEKHSDVRRRAFYLHANQARVAARKKPRFIKLPAGRHPLPIPVVESAAFLTNAASYSKPYAVSTKAGQEFTLYRDQTPEGPYELPVYLESRGTSIRIIGTPFTAIADTVMVGAVAGVFFLYMVAASGGWP